MHLPIQAPGRFTRRRERAARCVSSPRAGTSSNPTVAMASDDALEEAVDMARPPDHSSVEHTADGTRTEVELEAAAERLLEERDEVRTRLASMTADLESLFAASVDSNADDEHDPEGQTIAYERSQFEALIHGARDHLAGGWRRDWRALRG